MIIRSCTWAGVTASVYLLDKGEKIRRHRHPVDHSTMVVAGRIELEIDGVMPRSTVISSDPFIPLPANIDHEITAMEDGTIVLNMIAGASSGDHETAKPGGVMLADGTVV